MNLAETMCALLCEDVREEMGGKLSYLGVFGIENCGIIPDKIPSSLPRVCLVVMMSKIKSDIRECEITINIPSNTPIKMNYPIPPNFKKGLNGTLGLTIQPFKITSYGQGSFEIRFNNRKKPALVFNFNILEKSNQTESS